jgi:hypothetical protein
MSSLMNGICGATLTPTGTPCVCQRADGAQRGDGRGGARLQAGQYAASSVVTVTYTAARPALRHGGQQVQVALHAAATW